MQADVKRIKERMDKSDEQQEQMDRGIEELNEWRKNGWQSELRNSLDSILDEKLVIHQSVQPEYVKALHTHKESYETDFKKMNDSVCVVLMLTQINIANVIANVGTDFGRVKSILTTVKVAQEKQAQTITQIPGEQEAAKAATGSAQVSH